MPLFLVPIALAAARVATDPHVRDAARDFWLPPGAGADLEAEPAPLAVSPGPSSASPPGTVVPVRIPRAPELEAVGRLSRIPVGSGGRVSPRVPNLEAAEARYLLAAMPGEGRTEPGAVRGTTTVIFPRLTTDRAQVLLGHVQALNRRQLAAGVAPISPALHDGRIRYTRWDPDEEWRTARDIWRFGEGDCDDLAATVAAELEAVGIPARAILLRSGPGTIHAVVHRRDTGAVIDPSITGGMLGGRR